MKESSFKSSTFLRIAIVLLVALLFAAAILPRAMGVGATPDVKLTPAMRNEVIDALDAAFIKTYVYPEKAQAAVALLRERQRNGDYDAVVDPNVFAQRLKEVLQEKAGNDQHIRIMFSAEALPLEQTDEEKTWFSWDRIRVLAGIDALGRMMADFGVLEVSHLPGNIGYLKVDSFYPPELAGPKFATAMARLKDTSALILDLRDANAGGTPEGVALLSSYFFDKRTHLNDIYWRDQDITDESWTREKVSGPRYGTTRPVYILTGPDTFSACEEFVYNLQQLKRATVVGESTRGGAHPGRAVRLSSHFTAVVPGGRAVNPVSGTNWEGTGVVPDHVTTAERALKLAQAEILKARLAHETDAQKRASVRELIAGLR